MNAKAAVRHASASSMKKSDQLQVNTRLPGLYFSGFRIALNVAELDRKFDGLVVRRFGGQLAALLRPKPCGKRTPNYLSAWRARRPS